MRDIRGRMNLNRRDLLIIWNIAIAQLPPFPKEKENRGGKKKKWKPGKIPLLLRTFDFENRKK
jgi:hypothetical protein